MSNADLVKLVAEIDALYAKATKGPFMASKNVAVDGPEGWTLDALRSGGMGEVVYRYKWFRTEDDVLFDAALRNAWPALRDALSAAPVQTSVEVWLDKNEPGWRKYWEADKVASFTAGWMNAMDTMKASAIAASGGVKNEK